MDLLKGCDECIREKSESEGVLLEGCSAFLIGMQSSGVRKNIFNITRGPETVAKEVGMQEADFKAELKIARDKLLTVRSQRIRPTLAKGGPSRGRLFRFTFLHSLAGP